MHYMQSGRFRFSPSWNQCQRLKWSSLKYKDYRLSMYHDFPRERGTIKMVQETSLNVYHDFPEYQWPAMRVSPCLLNFLGFLVHVACVWCSRINRRVLLQKPLDIVRREALFFLDNVHGALQLADHIPIRHELDQFKLYWISLNFTIFEVIDWFRHLDVVMERRWL